MIRFTKHAEIRMIERGIVKEDVWLVLQKPLTKRPGKTDDKIVIGKIENRLLKVVYVEQEDDIIVVTTHRLSKLR